MQKTQKEEGLNNVFVYGTLVYDNVVNNLIGNCDVIPDVVLRGYSKIGLNIVEDKFDIVNGRILILTDKQLEIIDRYENLGVLYKKILVKPDGYDEMVAYQLIDSTDELDHGDSSS